jgi:DNA polymerase-1
MNKKCLLVDGSSLLYRAYFALPPMDADGVPTQAVHGFLMMLFKALELSQADYCCAAFDEKTPTFRHTMYADYKANRPPVPEDLLPQFDIIKEVLKSMKLGAISLAGYEADDLLGTISHQLSEKGYTVELLTGDRDALQLVDENVHLLFTRKGISEIVHYTPEEVKKIYKVSPEQVTDWKGLMGDSSDNIPGIPGVGEKTSIKLLDEYGTLENVLENADKIKGKLGEKVRANKEQARLSKTLATINKNAPIDYDIDSWEVKNLSDGAETLKRYRLNTALERINRMEKGSAEDAPSEQAEASFTVIDKNIKYSIKLEAGKPCSVVVTDSSVTLSQESINYKIPLQFGQMSLLNMADAALSDKNLKEVFAMLTMPLIVHDAKSLLHFLDGFSIPHPTIHWDSMLAAYLINPQEKSYALSAFANNDSAGLYALYLNQKQSIARFGMMSLYKDIELPLSQVLYEMELTGFKVDIPVLNSLGKEFTGQAEALQKDIIDSLDQGDFNINSPQQLGDVLFNKLKLPARKKTSSGRYSTDAQTLESIADYHPAISKILDYRQLAKLNSTYIDPLIKNADKNSRIHTTFDQTATATGRISSNDPNLQNIPVRTALGREIRKAFVAKEGCVLIDGDYSQIELRILAHMSEDKGMRDAFINGMDIHRETASKVYGVPVQDVTDEMRSNSKAINFGIVYGISDFGLARNIGVTRKEAASFIENYFEKFPGVKRFMDSAKDFAHKEGYAKTLYGRRRPLPELKSRNYHTRSFGERVAMNAPIQGTAADIIKSAMVKVAQELKNNNMQSRLILQVHDELIIEAPLAEQKQAAEILKRCMEDVMPLSVPLVCDINTGANWYESK